MGRKRTFAQSSRLDVNLCAEFHCAGITQIFEYLHEFMKQIKIIFSLIRIQEGVLPLKISDTKKYQATLSLNDLGMLEIFIIAAYLLI
jgi:hypothetical protein